MTNQFIKDRHEAFVNAVLNDDWKAVRRYCKKYDVPMPKKEEVFKAGIYKTVQYATDIPEEIKEIAFEKCLMLGFVPFIKLYEEEVEDATVN